MSTDRDDHSVRELYNAAFVSPQHDEMIKAEKAVKIQGIGTIMAIVMSASSILFTGGVVYSQVQQNAAKILSLEARVDGMNAAIIRIDTNVSYLADRAKEDRERFNTRRGGQ